MNVRQLDISSEDFGPPERVVINEAGEAVPPGRALREHNIKPDVIFIRADAWSLGAPLELEATAYMLWPKEWVAYCRKGWKHPRDIKEYAR
jgi:hypothetical protein